MSTTGTPARAKRAAEAAELRKAGADRPQSKARRGFAGIEGHARNCGRTAEELRKHNVPSPSLPLPAPSLVRLPLPKSREAFPPQPPSGGRVQQGGRLPPRVAEPGPEEGACCAGAVVLTHPAFDRPPVENVRRPGPKRGAVSLTTARRRKATAIEAERQARQALPPLDLAAELCAGPAPGGSGAAPGCAVASGLGADAPAVAAAVAQLDARLRRPGAVLDSPARVRAFLVLNLCELDREEFRVMFLDQGHALIAFECMSVGTLAQASVYPREVVRRALALNAAAVILAHNHPSGRPEPSRADEALTATLRQALALVDVRVLDHVAIGRLQAVSMAERGLM